MNRHLVQNFRGLRAVVLQGPDRSRTVLVDTLARLGLQVHPLDPADADAAASEALERAELVFFDADLAESPRLPWGADVPPIPLVVVIGIETPSRLLRAFELCPSAVLHKPVRSSGIYSALFFATNEHNRRAAAANRIRMLEARHGARRLVNKAILRVMERERVDDEQAYRALRKESMRQRVTVEELAARLLAEAEGKKAARKV